MKITVNPAEFRRLSSQRARDAAKARVKAAKPVVKRVVVKADRGRIRDNAYLAHTRRQSCLAVGLGGCAGRIDPAHLRFTDLAAGRINPGLARKSDDRWVLPLCRHHHDQQHGMNERAFWQLVGIDPSAECLRRYAAFQSENTTTKTERREV